MTGGESADALLPVSLKSCSTVLARKRRRGEFAPDRDGETLHLAARPPLAAPEGGLVPMYDPLSPIAPAIRSFESGEAIWALTETDPADSPPIVILSGSPPNAAMFRFTQSSAAC